VLTPYECVLAWPIPAPLAVTGWLVPLSKLLRSRRCGPAFALFTKCLNLPVNARKRRSKHDDAERLLFAAGGGEGSILDVVAWVATDGRKLLAATIGGTLASIEPGLSL
jgi:hypothetical protein